MEARDIAKILRVAKALTTQGWCQRTGSERLVGGGVNYCVMGAIGAAIRKLFPELREAYKVLHYKEEFVVKAFGLAIKDEVVDINTVVKWNDRFGRTQQEVIDAFERAAKMVEIGQELSVTTFNLKEEEHEPELVCK